MTDETALEEKALISPFRGFPAGPFAAEAAVGPWPRVPFASRRSKATVRAYGRTKKFMPYMPEQNGLTERFIRSLHQKDVWQQPSEAIERACEAIGGRTAY